MVQIVPPPNWQAKPPAEEAAGSPPADAVAPAAVVPAVPAPPPLPATAADAPLSERSWWQRRAPLLVVISSLAMLGVVVGLWALLRSSSTPPEAVPTAANTSPASTAEAAPAAPLAPERRWLPNQTRLWLSLRLARLEKEESFAQAVAGLQPFWQASVTRLLDGLGLRPADVAQLRWASPQLGHWSEACVVVLELEKGQDFQRLQALGEPIPLKLEGHQARQTPQGSWPLPFVVLGPETIVTGSPELLAALADASKVRLESASLGQLLETCNAGADAALVVDLPAVRQGTGRLLTALVDVWPAGRTSWPVLAGTPQAVAVALQSVEHPRWELGLGCPSEADAQKVQAALESFVPAVKAALEAQGPWLTAQRSAKRFSTEAASAYEQLLQQARAQIEATRREVVGSTVWIRCDASPSPAELATAAWACRDTVQASWVDAARAADSEVQHRVLEALEACRKAEGSWPAGAGEKSLLPPETQLSWIANLLPYLEHADWHKQLQSGYSWNSPQNRPVTSRPLPEVVNPALGPSSTSDGFPVTHYVGVAGVGADAGKLKAGDPRAGVFGFSRRTRPEDMADGASNTIATMGVQGQLGAWGSGGNATVRALTQRPYINGPDGFGSGQPDGMFVGMSDGSVRFLSKDIDPQVLEQLATANGHEAVTASILDPKPAAAPPTAAAAPAGANSPALTAEEAPAAEPPKAAEPVVLDDARLADPVARLEFADLPLRAAVDLISQLSTVPISYDLELLNQLGVGLRDPVTVHAEQTTITGLLDALTKEKGLGYLVHNGQVLLTAPEKYRTELKTDRYPVGDLLAGQANASALAELIRRVVAPESWAASGGRGSLEVEGDTLVLQQTPAVLDQVAAFCERLRMARGIPLRNPQLAKRLPQKPPLVDGRILLGRPVTTNFAQPAALARIVADLEQLTGATILVHWMALGEEGLGPRVEATLKAENLSLADALKQMLEPLGLAYRVVDATTLEILPAKLLAAQRELEIYPVSDLLDTDGKADALLGQLGEAAEGGVLVLDPPSKSLLVYQSQPRQAAVVALLDRLRTARPKGK